MGEPAHLSTTPAAELNGATAPSFPLNITASGLLPAGGQAAYGAGYSGDVLLQHKRAPEAPEPERKRRPVVAFFILVCPDC